MSGVKITRRRVLQLMGFGMAAHLLAACSSNGGGTAPAAAPAASPAAAAPAAQQAPAQKSGNVITINALMSVGGSGKALVGGLQKFNEKYKGQYEVKSEMIAIESLLEKEMAQFISGTATYDVLSINSDWLAGVPHFLEPLDRYLERDKVDFAKKFGARARAVVAFNDQLVALPVRFGTDIIFYRKDFMDEAGLALPKTHQEFRTVAQKLTKKDASGKVTRYGTSFKAQSPSWTVGTLGHFLFGVGNRYITADGKQAHPSLNSPLTQELLDTIKATIQDGSTPDVAAWTYDDNIVAFQEGRMGITDEYSARSLLIEDPKKSQAAGKMGYSMFIIQPLGPEPPTHSGTTWNFGIDKNSKNKDAAWALVNYMTGPEAQKYMALEFANGPTIIEIYDDPEYLKMDPAGKAIKDVLAGPGWEGYFPVPQLAELQKAGHEEIQAFYLGRQNSKQATENMTRRFNDILKS